MTEETIQSTLEEFVDFVHVIVRGVENGTISEDQKTAVITTVQTTLLDLYGVTALSVNEEVKEGGWSSGRRSDEWPDAEPSMEDAFEQGQAMDGDNVGIIEHEEGRTYPHCDWRILHRPGTCYYCDQSEDLQDDRLRRGINFTNENNPNKAICPAIAARGDSVDFWSGNVAKTKEDIEKADRELQEVLDEASRNLNQRGFHGRETAGEYQTFGSVKEEKDEESAAFEERVETREKDEEPEITSAGKFVELPKFGIKTIDDFFDKYFNGSKD